MASQVHLNPKTGKVGRCGADPANPKSTGCRFQEFPHFATEGEARAAYSASRAGDTLPSPRREKPRGRLLKGFVATGGALAFTFSMAACSQESSEWVPSGDTPSRVEAGAQPKSTETKLLEAAQKAKAAGEDALGVAKKRSQEGDAQALKRDAQALGEAAKTLGRGAKDPLKRGVEKLLQDTQSPGGATAAPGDVAFQGRSLKVSPQEVSEAKAALASLEVTAELRGDYNRERDYSKGFDAGVVGKAEHRDVTHGVFKNPSPTSRAIGGSFVDPYTGQKITIVQGSSQDTNVDHIIPLAEAQDSGAMKLSYARRHALANDQRNLAIVGTKVNQRDKSDRDAGEYLPSYQASQCRYAVAQITVKKAYNLSVDSQEKSALQQVLTSRCS